MSDLPEIDTAGLPEELSAVDQLLHRGEANPRTRSGIMGVELLDTTPDWDRFRARFENASRKVLRLRQKVVMPTLPTAAPRWVVDPDFNLDFHVRRVRVPAPGTLREVIDMAEVVLQSPMDISRPLWTRDPGRGAGRRPRRDAAAPEPRRHRRCRRRRDVRQHLRPRARPAAGQADAPLPIPQDLLAQRPDARGHQPAARRSIVGGVRGALGGAASTVARAVARSGLRRRRRGRLRALGRAGDGAGGRAVAAAAPPQPVVAQRGHRHQAGRPAQGVRRRPGGSINDAYLAGAVRGACGCYHEAKGMPVDDAADGRPGQPARGRRSGRRQPVRRRQPRRADRRRRPGQAHHRRFARR